MKWNLDSYYKNSIGDGFIFCAYSFKEGYFKSNQISGYATEEILEQSLFDLQFFGKKDAGKISKGNLQTYDFHPAANSNDDSVTNILMERLVKSGIRYQIEELGLKKVIIPNYYENDDLDLFIALIKTLNKWLKLNKKSGIEYYMTIPFTYHVISDIEKVEKILYHLTDFDIIFDGYYVVCESKPETGKKISVDFKYLNNLSTVLSVLKKQKFKTIYSYANWDALIFLSLADIDYITIGTYENLRNFSINRFTMQEDGGPSKGWYYSEKLLNFIKSPLLNLIRMQNGIELIRNEKNIFSDAILEDGYPWSSQKPEVHKNYLLSIDRLLKQIASINDMRDRKEFVLNKIINARKAYEKLENLGIFLTPESKNYHLDIWESFLRAKK
ncbi:MAG: hypothetical protein K9G49_01630 [Taibaiella sp.]|nr:hypothetical protein [Taibaiella sp.]